MPPAVVVLYLTQVAEDQYNDIISSLDAWHIGDDPVDADTSGTEADFRPTNSARRVKMLIEQITGPFRIYK